MWQESALVSLLHATCYLVCLTSLTTGALDEENNRVVGTKESADTVESFSGQTLARHAALCMCERITAAPKCSCVSVLAGGMSSSINVPGLISHTAVCSSLADGNT